MTPEEHRLLVETRDLAIENAKILRSIQKSLRTSLAIKIAYWVIVLGITFGAFYFIQPYIDLLTGSLSGVSESATSIEPFSFKKAISNLEEVRDLYQK